MLALIGVLGVRDRAGRRLNPGTRRILAAIGLSSLAAGVVIAVRASRDLGRNLTPMPRPPSGAELVETGIYRRIRHPIYAGLLLIAVGWATAMASVRSLVATGVFAAWLDAKARREEAWLSERFPEYAAYRARTHRFLPGVY